MLESAVERSMPLSFLRIMAGAALLIGCSSSLPDSGTPTTPTRTFSFAWVPGPCVEGENVVAAAAFVTGPGQSTAFLKPRDGELLVALMVGAEPRPVGLHWRVVADPPSGGLLPGPPWNLELTFDSPVAGECPLRVSFAPSAEAAKTGLGSAVSTVMLKEAPPPPANPGELSR